MQLEYDTFLRVEVLKNLTYYAVIKSPKMQVVEHREKDMIRKIFDALNSENATRLLPDDFRAVCEGAPELVRSRTVCDFIAGMTDRYAYEF